MITKCVRCGKEYNLNPNENAKDFQCECGGNLEDRRTISDVRIKQDRIKYENKEYYAEYKKKEPILSLILSFFIVGLGHLYNGQIEKGIILFVAGVVFAGLSIIFIGIPFFLAVWVYGMYDAYQSAVKINHGEEVRKGF